ncbi:hypothetical protein [Tropicimonas sediminicola]|uniref:Uncharacterized protein n=1 Tax=Tropicimonas sediminicola TaxID=1031541 RepID=A0A239DKH7_9RHOB|nr:hypothetical protein [Tropicimonas sediminicola]SNS32154.1 hypothetical protein SAMN05421757_101847 [Tropicimonas sediminicola]
MIATLGPAGSNHHRIATGTMGRSEKDVLLVADFQTALDAVSTGSADEILVCAAHPDCGMVVGRGQFALGLRLRKVFIAESAPLAILSRRDVEQPRSIALHPATRDYTDLSAWDEVIPVTSTVAAAEGLRTGAWDSALTFLRYRSEDLLVTRQIGAPTDAWIVLGP